jgi:hypothetical protein
MNNKTLILTTALTIPLLFLVGCSSTKTCSSTEIKIKGGVPKIGTTGEIGYKRTVNCTNITAETAIDTTAETAIDTTAETAINTTTETLVPTNTEFGYSNLSKSTFIPTSGNMSVGYVY